MIVDELIALLGYDVKGKEDLAKFNKSLDQLEKKAYAVARSISTFAVAASAAFVGGLTLLGKGALETGDTFEQLGIQLEALEGSQEKAKAAMDWITDFATRTPLELEDVVRGYTQLRTYGLDPTNGSFQALVDTMAMSGKGQEHLSGIITAVGQAWTKQKLQGEEAMQLLERGVPVWDLLSKAMHKSVPELQELATKGKLGRKEIALLVNEMGKRAEGASEKFARSLKGIKSNIADLWTEFKRRIANSGFFDAVKAQAERTLEVMKRWATDGTMDRVARAVGGTLTAIANGFGVMAERVVTHIDFLVKDWERLGPWVKGIGAALGAIAAVAFPVAAALVLAGFALEDFLTWLQGGDSIIGTFLESFSSIPDLMKKIDWTGLGRKIAGYVLEGLRLLGRGLAALFTGDADADFRQTGVAIANAIYEGLKALVQLWAGFWSELATAAVNAFADVGSRIASSIWSGLTSGLSGMGALSGSPAIQSQVENWKRLNAGVRGVVKDAARAGTTNNVQVNAPISMQVQQATQAPAAAAGAVQGAVKSGLQPSRMQSGPQE